MEHNVVFLFSSEHILMSFCFLPPAEKPAADTHTQPSRLSASSSSSDSSSSSSSSSSSDTSESDSGWETDSSYEKMSRRTLFSPSGLNLFKAADGAAGRAGEAGRDGAFPALSSDLKEVPALLPEEPASAGGVRDAPSPAHKEDWGVRWRDKGARARMCLISGDNFPFSPCSLSSCCIDEVYSTQYISFIKKHFMELIYSLIVGTMKLAWAKSFLFVFLSFFSEWIRGECLCVCFCANDVVTFFIVLTQALKKWVCTQKHLQNAWDTEELTNICTHLLEGHECFCVGCFLILFSVNVLLFLMWPIC